MQFNILIFLLPALLSFIVYMLFKNNKNIYISWSTCFVISFIFIFTLALSNTKSIDTLEIKNEIKNILTEVKNEEECKAKIYSHLNTKTENKIKNLNLIITTKNNKNLAVINYNEPVLNGVILLKNNLYVYY